MTITVRGEEPVDARRVSDVERAAFGGPFEPELVETLRRDASPIVSLVALQDDEIVGHVLFSPVEVAVNPKHRLFGALAPLAVDPAAQGRGIGGSLVREGLAACRALGWKGVFLVGDPRYYARFGFELAGPRGLRYGHPHFDAALQVLELERGALGGCEGRVRYHPAFGQADDERDGAVLG